MATDINAIGACVGLGYSYAYIYGVNLIWSGQKMDQFPTLTEHDSILSSPLGPKIEIYSYQQTICRKYCENDCISFIVPI